MRYLDIFIHSNIFEYVMYLLLGEFKYPEKLLLDVQQLRHPSWVRGKLCETYWWRRFWRRRCVQLFLPVGFPMSGEPGPGLLSSSSSLGLLGGRPHEAPCQGRWWQGGWGCREEEGRLVGHLQQALAQQVRQIFPDLHWLWDPQPCHTCQPGDKKTKPVHRKSNENSRC